jgi:hypothetical protein
MLSTATRSMLASLVLVLACGLAACGGDDGPDPAAPDAGPVVVPDAAPGGVPLAEFSDRIDQVYCDLDVLCRIAPSREACLQGQTDHNPIPQLVAGVAAGRATYDGVAAQGCLDAAHAVTTCDLALLGAMSEACDAVFTGKVAVGATCFVDDECVTGSCDTSSCTDDTCCAGACQADIIVGLGEPCSAGVFCDYDAYCPSEEGGAVCTARLHEGEACAAGSDSCGFGLICDGTCKRLPARGEACDRNVFEPCSVFGDICDATSHTCVAARLPGEACSADVPADCVTYAECVGDTCVAAAVEGEDCTSTACYRGLTCGPESKCVKRPADPICE